MGVGAGIFYCCVAAVTLLLSALLQCAFRLYVPVCGFRSAGVSEKADSCFSNAYAVAMDSVNTSGFLSVSNGRQHASKQRHCCTRTCFARWFSCWSDFPLSDILRNVTNRGVSYQMRVLLTEKARRQQLILPGKRGADVKSLVTDTEDKPNHRQHCPEMCCRHGTYSRDSR